MRIEAEKTWFLTSIMTNGVNWYLFLSPLIFSSVLQSDGLLCLYGLAGVSLAFFFSFFLVFPTPFL